MKMTKCFFDTEFTGLHQKTTLISLGIIAENGKTFYAEFTDYDKSQLNDWIQNNVIDKLLFTNRPEGYWDTYIEACVIGTSELIRTRLRDWLGQFDKVEMWSDCLSYDWVLFCQLYGHAFNIPENVYYMPFDICTVFRTQGLDPDINRELFAYGKELKEMQNKKHNALWDARTIKHCFEKLDGQVSETQPSSERTLMGDFKPDAE